MYNYKKICKCGYAIKYDSNRDIHNYESYVYCPICKSKLEQRHYCPNL